LNSPPRFLIIRLGSLGDIIHGIPAAAALRRHFPQARIDWVVDPRYLELLDLVEGLDGRIPFDSRGLTGGGAWSTLSELRAARYDAVLDFQGLIKSAVLARVAGGQRTVGLPRAHLREPMAALFYTTTADPGTAAHVIDKTLGLLTPLGVVDRTARFPIAVPRSAAALSIAERSGPDGYVLVNPGAAWPNKRWPPARFGALATAIHREHGLRSIVLWGPGEEPLAASVVAAAEGAAESAPPTTIPDIVAIARAARLMVSGDTGPLHIGGAMGTPLVALFGPTYPERNGPWSAHDVVLSRVTTCSCRYERQCRRTAAPPHHRTAATELPCIDDITVEQAVQAVRQRLSVHA
jgi:lipopolysaccharide heptosyltransferase I